MSRGAEQRVASASVVCHCEQVSYATVEKAVARGARSLADVQRRTGACTRCFGCRFELEGLLRNRLGESYKPTAAVTRVERRGLRSALRQMSGSRRLPRRMYMPFLQGYGGSAVTTRVVVFSMDDGSRPEPVSVRLDLLAPSGQRIDVQERLLHPGRSIIVDASAFEGVDLPDGFGTVKMVADVQALHSLRPYFQLVTPSGITTTHEKAGTAHPRAIAPRPHHWLHPIGRLAPEEDAFIFCVNTQERSMQGQQLVWRSVHGEEDAYELPLVELDGAAFVSFRGVFPSIAERETAGTVRLEPALHKVAGFMLRHDATTDRWRVQHL